MTALTVHSRRTTDEQVTRETTIGWEWILLSNFFLFSVSFLHLRLFSSPLALLFLFLFLQKVTLGRHLILLLFFSIFFFLERAFLILLLIRFGGGVGWLYSLGDGIDLQGEQLLRALLLGAI